MAAFIYIDQYYYFVLILFHYSN